MWVYGLVYQLCHHHYRCALLDLMSTVSCQFGKNHIHFLPPKKPLISRPKKLTYQFTITPLSIAE